MKLDIPAPAQDVLAAALEQLQGREARTAAENTLEVKHTCWELLPRVARISELMKASPRFVQSLERYPQVKE
jgi:hypothetical protein